MALAQESRGKKRKNDDTETDVQKKKVAAPESKPTGITKHIGASKSPNPKRWESCKDLDEVFRRGPNGAPVYDNKGFELDYKKVTPQFKSRGRSRPSWKKMSAMMEKNSREKTRKCELMGMEENQISAMMLMAWADKISTDLAIPYHKVRMEDFEEWHRRGFRAQPGEFEAKNISEEDAKRITDLATGSAFRK